MRRTISHYKRVASVWLIVLTGLASPSCAPRFDGTTVEGKAAIIDQTNKLLTSKSCDAAIASISSLYESQQSDNDVRMVASSAYACKAGIEFFALVNSLSTADLGGSAFWQTMTQLFPSQAGDDKLEASYVARDALLATIRSGVILQDSETVNSTTNNPGSLSAVDRTDDANSYLTFVSMAMIGTTQNRYGAPNADYQKTQNLPWTLAADVDAEGCSYAGAVVNLIDSIQQISSIMSGSVSSGFDSVVNTLRSGVEGACALGCIGKNTDFTDIDTADCTFTSCNGCPAAMKHSSGCSAAATEASCAAAGLVRFINNDTSLGWVTGS